MTYAVAINSSGQATIPKVVRDELNIVPGENRLLIERDKNGRFYLAREVSRAEQLDASLNYIHRRLEEEKRRNPEIAANIKKYAGMTFEEIRDAYDNTPEGKKEFEEKYGIRL